MASRWLAPILDVAPSVEIVQAVSDFQEISQQLHERYGLAPLSLTEQLFAHAEELNIFALPRQFQPDAEAFDDRYLFVGPCIAPRSESCEVTLDWPTDRKILYTSLGTAFNGNPEFFAACFDAFADSDWQVLLSIGTRVTPSTIGRTPDNFLISSHMPQLEILQRADMFITHGGVNSIMEAIYYGVPMVVVPQQPEQEINATRVAELGLGVVLEREQVTPSALRAAVNAVSDDASYRNRVAHTQKAAREAGGYSRAADAIQQFGYQHVVIESYPRSEA